MVCTASSPCEHHSCRVPEVTALSSEERDQMLGSVLCAGTHVPQCPEVVG